jgi:hypothetical protein
MCGKRVVYNPLRKREVSDAQELETTYILSLRPLN